MSRTLGEGRKSFLNLIPVIALSDVSNMTLKLLLILVRALRSGTVYNELTTVLYVTVPTILR